MTDTDKKLIALLQDNARASITELAADLGVARATVRDRLTRLEEDGTITGYTVVLDKPQPTDRVQALVMIKVRQQQSQEVVTRLKSFPQIIQCLAINGENDLCLTVETPKLAGLDKLLDEIARLPGIERSRSSIVLAEKFKKLSST